MSAFLASQALAALAFVFDFASFQYKKREVTLRLFAISASLLSAHFFLLGQATAGVVVGVSAIRFFTSTITRRREALVVFLILMFIGGIYTFDGYEDILSITASTIATCAAFLANEKTLRHLMMITTSLFIIHNVWIGTPVGVIIEVSFLGSNLLSQWRFYRTSKSSTSQKQS